MGIMSTEMWKCPDLQAANLAATGGSTTAGVQILNNTAAAAGNDLLNFTLSANATLPLRTSEEEAMIRIQMVCMFYYNTLIQK